MKQLAGFIGLFFVVVPVAVGTFCGLVTWALMTAFP